MLSAKRPFPAFRPPWRMLCCSIALAIAAGTYAPPAQAQSFVLYDPAISASPQTVTSAVLADLTVPNSYISADGAMFSNFQFSASAFGGAPTPSAATIVITAPTSPSPELFFKGGPFIATGSQFIDASLQFDVTELDPMQKITTAELKYTGGTDVSGGTTSITEDIDDMADNLLGQGAYIEQPGYAGSSNHGKITFAGQQEIQVSKDIMLYGSGSLNSETLSDFSQTFDASTPAVPEPSSIVMAIMGSGGLGWFGWRRKAKRRDLLRTFQRNWSGKRSPEMSDCAARLIDRI